MNRLIYSFIAGLVYLFSLSLEAAENVQVRFLAERAPKGLGAVAMIAGDSRSNAFELPVNNLSPVLAAPARTFHLRPVGQDVDLAQVALPEAGESFVVLLIPAKAGGYSCVVISAVDPSFKPGDVYLYNHAGKPILGYVGTSKFVLEVGRGRTLTPQGAKDGRYYDVGLGVREKEGDRLLSQTRWPVDDRSRSYVFFFVNPETGRIDFRAVDEFLSANVEPGT